MDADHPLQIIGTMPDGTLSIAGDLPPFYVHSRGTGTVLAGPYDDLQLALETRRAIAKSEGMTDPSQHAMDALQRVNDELGLSMYDPTFTDGVPSEEYVRRFRAGKLGPKSEPVSALRPALALLQAVGTDPSVMIAAVRAARDTLYKLRRPGVNNEGTIRELEQTLVALGGNDYETPFG
jgi:hypothetical protein